MYGLVGEERPKLSTGGMQGDIERDLASARLDYHGALSEFIMEMVEAGGGMICDAIPDAPWT